MRLPQWDFFIRRQPELMNRICHAIANNRRIPPSRGERALHREVIDVSSSTDDEYF